MTLLTHGTCPQCGHDKCFTDFGNGWGYCHSECQTSIPTGKQTKETTVSKDVTKEVSLPYRSIPASVVDFYGIKTGVNKDDEPIQRLYPYPTGTKRRILPKDFSDNKGFKPVSLFGMDKFNAGTSKSITLVEGEDDAPSAYFMLGERYPVVSLPNASLSEALLKNVYDYLNSFEEIIVATDNDAAGDKVALKVAATFPNKTSRISMTKHKDASAFLTHGDNKDFLFAFHNRQKYVPEGIYNTKDQFLSILSADEGNDYIPTPSTALNDKISGIMRGRTTVITGEEGLGKTEILRWFEVNILENHPTVPIAVLHMEESKKECLESYACYVLKKNLRDPDRTVPQEDIDAAVLKLTENDNLYLFDFGADADPLTIIDKVRYFSEVCGCHYVFIDPIQNLSYGKDKDATEEKTLSQISVQLSTLATELNVGVVMTSHVNDDGAIRSSRMIGKSAAVRMDIKRDHMNPDKSVANVTHVTVSKNRPTSKTGYGATLFFDEDSFTLGEVE